MRSIITVNNISKKYVIRHDRRQVSTPRRWSGWLGRPRVVSTTEEFWALKDLSFEVAPGERLGIIGGNGAGKSTLLKILSRIVWPTTGRVEMSGRVASLLEVGTGFHPELTGRENIYMNAALLGMSRADVRGRFDEIVDFACIGQFLDTPVKRYSSGMYVRLAFAVAANLDPDILIVDEVLAVGDAQFQRKCLGKMRDASNDGRTIIFVSHNMDAITHICNRAIWLKDHRAVVDSEPTAVVHEYLHDGEEPEDRRKLADVIAGLPPDPVFRLADVRVTQEGRVVEKTAIREKAIDVEIDYDVLQTTPGFQVVVAICDDVDTAILRTAHDDGDIELGPLAAGSYTSRLTIPANLLGPIPYKIRILAGINGGRRCMPLEEVFVPVQIEQTKPWHPDYPKVFLAKVAPDMGWQNQRR